MNLFNEAVKHYKNLRNVAGDECRETEEILEIIRLCQLDIRQHSGSGDAYVLLANAFLTASTNAYYLYHDLEAYEYLVSCACAVIHHWILGGVWTRNKEIGARVLHMVSTRLVEWKDPYDVNAEMARLHDAFYAQAVNPESMPTIERLLFGIESTHPGGAMLPPTHADATVHYQFAHIVLPELALTHTNEFYSKVFRDGRCPYLERIWCDISKNSRFPDDRAYQLRTSKRKLPSGHECCSITLPRPTAQGEAFYVSVTGLVGGVFRYLVTQPRYFTLELGCDDSSPETRYYVCEWLTPVPKRTRANHGGFPRLSERAFLGAVATLVRGGTPSALSGFPSQPPAAPPGLDAPASLQTPCGVGGPAHAIGHQVLRDYYALRADLPPEGRAELDAQLLKLEAWAGVQNRRWSPQQQCRFACQYELYATLRFPSLAPASPPEPLDPDVRDALERLQRRGKGGT